MSEKGKKDPLFGAAAQFDSPEALLEAARRVHEAGYRRTDAFSPFAIEGLAEALGSEKTAVAKITGLGGLVGAAGGFFMLWYANVISYPWNIGGRPRNSWPAWIPITFELGVLFAGLSAAIGMLILNGLPQPYHAMFNVPEFSLASKDKFFIVIESCDPKFDKDSAVAFLQTLNPTAIMEVPR